MVINDEKISWKDIWIVLPIYILLMAFHGYRFGDEDMMESLSYANYLLDASLYPKDLYIQAVAESKWNERFPFATFLSFGGEHPAWYCFVIHLSTSLTFIWASLLIARKYINHSFWQLIFILLFFFASYHINLGENEAWYNYMMPSYLAKSLAIWAIYFFLSDRVNLSFVLLIASTFSHPIVGAQLALIFGIIWLYEAYLSEWKSTGGWKGILAYGLIAGAWIGIIFFRHLVADQAVSDAAFYEIMETRLGHHFFPGHYPLKSWLLLIPLMTGGMLYWFHTDKRLFRIFAICFAGMFAYYIGVEVFETPQLLSLQWFKTTVWLKPFSLIALCAWLSNLEINIHRKIVPILLSTGVLLALIQFSTQSIVGDQKPYHFPFSDFVSSEMEMAQIIKEELASDATILIPPNLTAVRYWSERGLYIDYKSNIHSRTYMGEAARRRQLLYGMNIKWRQEKKHMVNAGVSFFKELSGPALQKFKVDGATHVLTTVDHHLPSLQKIVENDLFVVYQL